MFKTDLHYNKKKDFITAKFLNHFIRKERNFPFTNYVEYSIEIKNSLNQSWTIYKRYKCFQKLHKKLCLKLRDLPNFPPKKFFNMTRKIIAEREIALEHYLNYLLDKIDLLKFPEILQFILSDEHDINSFLQQIKDASDPGFVKKYSSISFKSRSRSSENQNYISSSIRLGNPYLCLNKNFAKLIETFLENLEDAKEDMCYHIQHFWKAFKEVKWTNVKKEDVIKLIYGNSLINGLLFHCGMIKVNLLGAQEALLLLHKLIRYDFNPDCDYYITVLKMIKMEYITQMNINLHLIQNKQGVNEACFQLISHFTNLDNDITSSSILMNRKLEERYENWLRLQDEI